MLEGGYGHLSRFALALYGECFMNVIASTINPKATATDILDRLDAELYTVGALLAAISGATDDHKGEAVGNTRSLFISAFAAEDYLSNAQSLVHELHERSARSAVAPAD